MFHFDKDFVNKNNERLMLPIRFKSLLKRLNSEYVIKSEILTGDFEYLEKECTYNEAIKDNDWILFKSDKDLWGKKDQFVWFRQTITIPSSFKDESVWYIVNPYLDRQWPWGQPQIEMFVNGKCKCGLDNNHPSHLLIKKAKGNETITIYLKAYCDRTYYNGQMTMSATLQIIRPEIYDFYKSIDLPLRACSLMNTDSDSRIQIIKALNNAMNALDLYEDPDSIIFKKSMNKAKEILDNELYNNDSSKPILYSIGHSHIDVAWLWTYRVTRNKATRTFATNIDLIENNPDYLFMSSQPQLYEYVKEDEPELYEKIKKAIKDNRWEVEGGMWVEADTNITGGESLVRQFLFGKRFFKEEFNKENEVLWLPDVFGYSANLPQICQKSGIKYFYTTKIGWNEYNKFPYDTFNWRGIDGTTILTHFGCAIEYKEQETDWMTTYNPDTRPEFIIGAWNRYQQKNLNKTILYDFGYGDGGGGPTQQMIDEIELYKKGIPGCPNVMLTTVKSFFHNLENEVSCNNHLPEWSGEMYLEFHRGTYTSQALTKKNNRESEHLYHDIENLASLAMLVDNATYPQKAINASWKEILLNQFHDVLPGSSIHEVYQDTLNYYNRIFKSGKDMLNTAIDSIAKHISINSDSIVVLNTLSYKRSPIVIIDEEISGLIDSDGSIIPCQKTYDNKTVFIAKNVPSKGYKAFKIKQNNKEFNKMNCSLKEIETNKLIVKFDDKMHIISLFDKNEKRETLPKNKIANQIIAYEDVSLKDDAWNVQAYYEEKSFLIDNVSEANVIENGPVRCVIQVKRKFKNSLFDIKIIAYKEKDMLYFDYDVDWHEHNLFVKAEYPIDVNAKNAVYDIQFSYIERPVHKNTLWDFARFECCGHKFADLSDNGYGLSIINDCKYGYNATRDTLKISLLKCSTYPDKMQDQGHHSFAYAIYPHSKNHIEANTTMLAYDFNYKPLTKHISKNNGNLPSELSFFFTNKNNIVIETIKKAEDSDEIIVRMYESENKQTICTFNSAFSIIKAFETNLMEEEIKEININDNCIDLHFKPFEIKTISLKIK